MSGIYIKGMEMPTSCMACQWSRTDITNTDWCVLTEKDLPCDCPLVSMPDHGRLIDADEFYKDINESVLLTDRFKDVFNLWFDEQPTIIPADKRSE